MYPVLNDNQKKQPHLLIGQVAEETGASPKAIRYYESLGLIPIPERKGKYRIYSTYDVFLIHVIKQAQTIGFSLNELKKLLTEQIDKQQFPLHTANKMMEEKRLEFRSEIKKLKELEKKLDTMKAEMNNFFPKI
ncbi:MAG: MerR family transcriptional regulator [Methylococcales bacterium]|nr:MerR family transcriptional regulator [Methylococcales bacterium]